MPQVKLESIIEEDTVSSYLFFREIEDWCTDNIAKTDWKFYFSPPICVQGVDLPGRIFFKYSKDMEKFLSHVNYCRQNTSSTL